MKRITVKDFYYGEKLFAKKSFNFEANKLNILVGPNGTGKTTLLRELAEKFKDNSATWFIADDAGHKAKNKAMGRGEIQFVADLMSASEGEGIVTTLGTLIDRIKKFKSSTDKNKKKDLWILIDGIDSGLDMSNISEFKSLMARIIFSMNKLGHTVYPIISANNYEMISNEGCVYVKNNTRITFKDYEEYRTFIINESAGRAE